MRTFGRFLVLSLFMTAPAAARDIHVSNVGGDDSFLGIQVNSRGDRTGPVRTIARALQLANGGDRIVLAKTGEPYRESITLVGRRHSGYPELPFTIDGNGATLDGSMPVPAGEWENYSGAIFRFQPPRKDFFQLFHDGVPVLRTTAERIQKPTPPVWCVQRGEFFLRVAPDKLPDDYGLYYASKQTGITLLHVSRVRIIDLTVQGFRIDGISAFNSARDVYLGGITARGNGRSGISVGGASVVEIDQSLSGNNGEAQLLTLAHSKTTVVRSELLSNTAPAWLDRGGRVLIDGQLVHGGIDEQDVKPPAEDRN